MSRCVRIDNLSDSKRKQIADELQIRQEPSKYSMGLPATFIYPYEVKNDNVYLPFSYHNFPRPERTIASKQNKYSFTGELRKEQKEVQKEAISYLNKYGSTIIASRTGFGKTCLAINLSSKIKLKTLIIVHRIILINQWKSSIKKFCPEAKVQIVKANTELEDDIDFYIMNAINIPKNPRSFYKDMLFLIVDEAHLIMAERLSRCMLSIVPRYVLGLSATPYRNDGLNILFDLYFGRKKIERKLWHPHLVYRVNTGFTPTVELARNGKINWNVILESQCNDEGRNKLILDIIQFFPKRIFLVLCKRVAQAHYLVQKLKDLKEDVTSLIGSQQEFTHSSRILVGTSSKCGVGFDHPRLDSLILASDIEQYFIQYLGRIIRRKDVQPVVFDLVDINPILKKHFRTRCSVYTDHGGSVKDFHTEFPQFRKKLQ